jgi:GR25 family glycosyltransferase involved in LPS biosynthesis
MSSIKAVVIDTANCSVRTCGNSESLKRVVPWLHHEYFTQTGLQAEELVASCHNAGNPQQQRNLSFDGPTSDHICDLEESPNDIGLSLSHIRAWRYCVDEFSGTDKPLLVLEDDVEPAPEFTRILRCAIESLPPDAHVLYLGRSSSCDWRREVSTELVESSRVCTPGAYLLWPVGAKTLLSKLPVVGFVEDFMLSQCSAGNIKAYAVRQRAVIQMGVD